MGAWPDSLCHSAVELGRLLLPPRCLGCRGPLPVESEALLCPACRGRLREPPWPRCPRCHFPTGTGRAASEDCLACREWPPALVAARWAVALEPPADALVHGLKYEGWRRLAPAMARRMSRLDRPAPLPDPPLVVPVPTTRRRRRRRGYNQAHLLAAAYAAHLDEPLVPLLERREDRARQVTQVALHPDERRANVREAFRVRRGSDASCRDRWVVLVDDVLTTGATAGAAAETLERAGCIGVVVVTFARALPRGAEPAVGARSRP